MKKTLNYFPNTYKTIYNPTSLRYIQQQPPTTALALTALGVVYGDIGTSPLYTIKECFYGLHAISVNQANVLGVLSLIFWSLTIVISLKYVAFIIRADNRGEGGIFALLALLAEKKISRGKYQHIITLAAIFGAGLLYGDGIITPAISVLSAIEGLKVATSTANSWVIPLTCLVLMLLFLMQHYGTAGVGRIFGPIMAVWFITISILGLYHLVQNPTVLSALNPIYAIYFFIKHRLSGLIVLASVVLCITGGEALYADLGHFGRRAIRLSWFSLVYPGLLLNYFGQGALLLTQPEAASNPFYGLVPHILHYPMIALSTIAAIIASQAMISGVFSLSQQAVQIGYLPRLKVIHTSKTTEGQIFVPAANYTLMVTCLALVLTFQETSRLAGAYGIAVSTTMSITSILYYFVIRYVWRWSLLKTTLLLLLFLFFDFTYFGANLLKIIDGGWLSLTISVAVTIAMITWGKGRLELSRLLSGRRLPLEAFLKEVDKLEIPRVPGTAIFLALSPEGTPPTLLHFFKLNKILHERIVFLSILSIDIPQVTKTKRITVENLGHNFFQVLAYYGFIETPNVPDILRLAGPKGLKVDPLTAIYFLGRESLLPEGKSNLPHWQKLLFMFMSRNASNPTAYLGVPPHRVIEVGIQIAI